MVHLFKNFTVNTWTWTTSLPAVHTWLWVSFIYVFFKSSVWYEAYILGKASRTEKYLGACACGKWVLRKSYMEACRAAGRFVEVS